MAHNDGTHRPGVDPCLIQCTRNRQGSEIHSGKGGQLAIQAALRSPGTPNDDDVGR
ncbi:hypothetical protein GCM10009582_20250 [Arthrobacter flavus]